MGGSREREGESFRGAAAPDAASFATLFLGLRDTIQREGAAVLPNAELYAWILDALARDVARSTRIPDVPYRAATGMTPVPACGNRIEEILTKRGMTKSELARRVGLSRFGLQKLIRGSRPGYDLAMAIAAALDIDATVVFPAQVYRPRRRREEKPTRRTATRSSKHPHNPEK